MPTAPQNNSRGIDDATTAPVEHLGAGQVRALVDMRPERHGLELGQVTQQYDLEEPVVRVLD